MNNNKTRIGGIVLIILLGIGVLSAQQLPEKAMGQPKIFQNEEMSNTWQTVVNKKDWGELSNNFWKVYIDREGVKSYTESTDQSKIKEKSLNFLDDYFVAKTQNGYALLYDEKYQQSNLTITKSAKAIGWVKINELLLWSVCPRTQNQVYQKAVIVKDLDSDMQNKSDINKASPQFSTDPNGEKKSRYRATELEFYFVYKIENGAALLMIENKLVSGKINSTKHGWMKGGEYTPWNERLCFEPEFGQNISGTASVFKDHSSARKYKNNGDATENTLWKDELPQKRWNTKKVRFPVLELTEDFIAEVGTISSFDGSGTTHGQNQKTLENAKEKLAILKHKMQQINIVFVVDGTSSMRNYFKPMAESIKLAMTQNEMKGYNVNFGAVVYRDYADKEKAVEFRTLTTNYSSIAHWLLSREISSVGKSHHEALYLGLETALDRMSWEKANSNFLVLVGDAGNATPDQQNRSLENVAEKMGSKEINFIAYQGNHPDHIAYHDFVSQTQRIMNLGLKSILNRKVTREDFVQKGHLYSANVKKTFTISAGYHYAGVGSSEPPKGLQDLVESKIVEFKNQTEDDIKTLEELIGGEGQGAETGGAFGKELIELLKQRGFSDAEIEALQKANLTIKIKGYTSRVAGTKKVFAPCVFLTKEELNELIQSLSTVTRGNSTNRRLELQQALKKLVLSYIGQQSSDNDISIDEIMEAMQGVGKIVGTHPLLGVKLKDITNPNRINDAQIEDFISQVQKGVERLRSKQNDKSSYFVSPNGLWYYYILLDEMPLQ